MTKEELESELIKSGWSREALELAIRAKFKCEYCDLDFFKSYNDYDSFQVDHIIPDGNGDIKNLAASCKTCNYRKRAWDPSKIAGKSASRDELVEAIRNYIKGIREEKDKKIEKERILANNLLKVLKD